ncbi:uncharacterized protein LOC135832219 [Planococcus citri]|uniref:uncharacterized protein LOC135832219 n=1 Tax=Planococcus citri TaxID=170843 RepID=UPI0031F782FD
MLIKFIVRVMEIRLIVLLILFNFVHRLSADLTCYECTTQPNPEPSKSKSCSQFDESEKYEVTCPYSTFCLKRTYQYTLQGGKTVEVVERGCAPQKHSFHVYENNRWVPQNTIEKSIYEEGCIPFDPSGTKQQKSEYCYCSSNLCNTGKRATEASFFHHTDTMSVIFIFNVVKLMRSVR